MKQNQTVQAEQKIQQKPVQKPKAKTLGLSVSAVATLDAFAIRFLTRAIGYHESQGNLTLTADGAALLTAKGINAMSSRKGLQAARDRQTKGGKSEQGTPYYPAPKGFPVKFVFPFGKREEGTADSQAAFAALMLATSSN